MRSLMSFKNFIFRLYRKSITKKHELNYLFWECTLRCNLNCLHCGSDCLKISDTPDMPVKDFVNILDNIKSEKLTVCITGGEPLLRKDLEAAGLEIKRRGFKWGIVTNAMLLTPQRFESLVQAGMSSISFSLDGLEKEHTYLRKNPESYKHTCEGIKLAVDYQKKNPHRFAYDVITCVHNKNLNILKELRKNLIELGVIHWRIFSIFPEGRAEQNNLALTKDEYKQLMDFIVETRSYKNEKNRSIHLNYSCEGWLGKYELKARDFFFFCRGGINVGSVMCNGDISACLSVRSKDFIQGNIYKDNFMDVWNNRFENLRNRKWTKKGKCKKCREWNKCLGNGLHLHHDMISGPAHCNYELLNK